MRDKREIGFDILDNADLNQIEEFAMDSNMLDDETKNRIKNIIDKKCKEAKGEIIMNNKNFIRNTNDENTVSHVEIYKERKITKIISAVVSVAAVFGIVAGGAALIRNNKIKPEDIAKSSSNIDSVDSDNYEAAAQDVFKQIFQSNQLTELKYDYIDITGDATPELFVSYNTKNIFDYCAIYEYNGKEFDEINKGFYQRLMISNDNNSLALISEEGGYDIVLYDFEPDKEKVLSASEDNSDIFNVRSECTSCRIFEKSTCKDWYLSGQYNEESSEEYYFRYIEEPIRCEKEISEEEYNQIMDRYDAYGWTELKIDKYTVEAETKTYEEAITSAIINNIGLSYDEYSYSLMDFTGDSTPELFVSIKSEYSDNYELHYGEFNGYFYKMYFICSGKEFMVSEQNKSISCINNLSVYEEYDCYSIELYDFAPDETKIKADGEIIFNQYENNKFTSMSYLTQDEDKFFITNTGYSSGPSEDNPDGPIRFGCNEEMDYSKELYIEKMNEYDSYGWSEMEYIQYDIETEKKYDDTNVTDVYESAAIKTANSVLKNTDASGISYDLVDLNNDTIPELIINEMFPSSAICANVYFYQNNKYENIAITETSEGVMYCADKNLIIFLAEGGADLAKVIELGNNNIVNTDEYWAGVDYNTGAMAYKHNGEIISKEEYQKKISEINSYDWHNFNFK